MASPPANRGNLGRNLLTLIHVVSPALLVLSLLCVSQFADFCVLFWVFACMLHSYFELYQGLFVLLLNHILLHGLHSPHSVSLQVD